MPKLLLGFVAAWIALGPSFNSCKDATYSMTHLRYYKHRDMRNTVALKPQQAEMRAPDSLSVPVGGKAPARDRDWMAAHFQNPVPMDDASIARGERKFARTCVPCHGQTLVGNGPVAAQFMPPPDLLGSSARGRSDGFIYYYIRHGGAIMPSYGAQVSAEEAYDLINYIRNLQRTSPR